MPLLVNRSVSEDAYQSESEKIRARFEQSHNGLAAVHERSNLLDSTIQELWSQSTGDRGEQQKICVAALGGYGRRSLFPFSDVDLLFLYDSDLSEHTQRRQSLASVRLYGIVIFE